MKKLKKRTLWIATAVEFVLAIALIFVCTVVKDPWTKVIIVLIAVVFIALTITVQMASYQTFRYKPKPVNYPRKSYTGDFASLKPKLKKLGYQERKTPYGSSFLKVFGNVAYKCVLVEDSLKYFTQEPQEDTGKPNKELESCTHFVGVEIFHHIEEENVAKLPDFTLQGKNIYYTALLYQENQLFLCLNYMEPQEPFKEAFERLLSQLELTEYKEQDKE